MDKVEGRDTYKIKLTMKNGQAIHVWIDAQTFLETKLKGSPGGSMASIILWKCTTVTIGCRWPADPIRDGERTFSR